MTQFDAIVLGLGAMGSAALLQLSRRGLRVLGIDRFHPPHPFGSSHGATRITRAAIGEGGHLSPLALRSHALWREVEAETGTSLFSATGVLMISSAAKTSFTHVENFFANTLAAAERYGIAHEMLDAAAIRARFPQFRVRDDEMAYYEPGAGFLRPEACIAAQLSLAERNGATIRLGETVTRFDTDESQVRVETAQGDYTADKLIVTAGPWLPELLDARLSGLFRVHRQVLFWFAPDDEDAFTVARFPTFIWELAGRAQAIYGFPAIDSDGVKIATEQYQTTTTPSLASSVIDPGEAAAMHEAYVAPFFSGVSAHCRKAQTCLYTVTPDFGFVIDRHPDSERVLIASCCSGHGFKHSPAIGEALAELVLDGRSTLDLSGFRLARFAED